MSEIYLGIDLGTSSVKAVLVDADDAVLAGASVPLEVQRPRPGWSEQDPRRWWEATLEAVDRLQAEAPRVLAATVGIGLSGQMHGAVLLGEGEAVLRPAILWNDGRAAAECPELDGLREVTGNAAMPGFTAPKLLWVRRHEPAIFAATRLVLLPKAYLRLCLCGEAAEDMSDASGTLWLDVAARDWSDAALGATGLSRAHMPRLVEGNAATGRLHPALAARWGMATRPVIAGGAGDNAASAVGLGAVRPGDAFLSLGTSGVLWATTDRFRPNPARFVHAFCHALPGLWHQMSVHLSAAGSLEWWAQASGATVTGLLAEVGAPARPSSALFLPYLSGERTPHNDAAVRGAFLGLDHAADRATLTQAVLEGVAFAIRDGQEALAQAGAMLESAIVTGGGSRSRSWVAILASVLGVPLARPAAGEHGAALGAARLGRMAATGEDPATVCRKPVIAETVEPEPRLVCAYAERYAQFRAAYPAMKGVLS